MTLFIAEPEVLELPRLSFDQSIERACATQQFKVRGLPIGAMSYWIARRAAQSSLPFLIVCADSETQNRIVDNLRFFASENNEVACLVGDDLPPWREVMSDRTLELERLAWLDRLAHNEAPKFLVVSVDGLLRRWIPKNVVQKNRLRLEFADRIKREVLVQRLVRMGYARTPLAEEPGTFSVRGAILDVYSPLSGPIRIEFEGDDVRAIHNYDPFQQQNLQSLERCTIPVARELIEDEENLNLGRARLRALSDDLEMPTQRANEILQSWSARPHSLEYRALAWAPYLRTDTLLDYLGHSIAIFVEPEQVATQARTILERADEEWSALHAKGKLLLPLQTYYVDEKEIESNLGKLATVRLSSTAIVGSDERNSNQSAASDIDGAHLEANDHQPLIALLKARNRSRQHDSPLQPLFDAIRRWNDEGMRVVISARTSTQATRVHELLRNHGISAQSSAHFVAADKANPVTIVVGHLGQGFVLPDHAFVSLSDEELFGRPQVARTSSPEESRRRAKKLLQNLQELKVGDFVVHPDHGIGRYLGLEYKALALSATDRLQGKAAQRVEVLVIEYAAGDRLFLPVTRVDLIHRYSGQEGKKPALDRLGGLTFAKKKSRAREAVQQLAEELLQLYAQRKAVQRPPLQATEGMYQEFEAAFPFEETPDQAKAIEDVLEDLLKSTPMDRLVCGDVGFGKTEVAMRAACRMILNGRQVALLCPTTVLAQQHFRTWSARFAGLPCEIRLLSRFVSPEDQAQSLVGMQKGSVDIVIGTHRLLSKDVHFKDLGLLVVDEEQRFGVTQKERLKKLRTTTDVLTLSATPIPRTLQMAIGAVRDLSLIATPPTDRHAIRTFLCRWDPVLIREAIEHEVSRGGQIFYVYNRIEDLHERAARVQALLPKLRIAVAHGQMAEHSLETTMNDFIDGKYDMLCTTAIIENGIDIPRANTMIIDRAERLGLSQLYQLRGRVGRSSRRAYCYLVAPSGDISDEARMRLQTIERFTELGAGFQVASLDLELRGAGDFLGAEQSGNVALVGFDMFVDMLDQAATELRGEAYLTQIDPELVIDLDHYLPDDYVEDISLRLSAYRRLAQAESDVQVDDIGQELVDRFGALPLPAQNLLRVMSLKPRLRALRVLSAESSANRIALHLNDDTPLDPAKTLKFVQQNKSPWKFGSERKLIKRIAPSAMQGDSIERLAQALQELSTCLAENQVIQIN